MKKLLIISIMMLLGVACFAQTSAKDRINLKTGKTIKCTIYAVDTVSMSIQYSSSGEKNITPLKEVASYIWNGKVNAGLPQRKASAVSLPATNANKNVYINGKSADPGQMLVKFADQAQTGLGLMIAGSVLSSSAWVISDDVDTQKFLAISGLAISTAGLIVHVISFSKARKAGELLQINDNVALGVGNDGVGLVIKL